MKESYTRSDQEMKNIACEILYSLKGQNLILLKGELGSGKTTFAQGMLSALDAEGPFTSPTFVIMKRYELGRKKIANGEKQINLESQIPNSEFNFVYHFDCYRVGSIDIQEMGWEEIINDRKNLVLLEWPERIIDIIPQKHIMVEIEMIDRSRRHLRVTDFR